MSETQLKYVRIVLVMTVLITLPVTIKAQNINVVDLNPGFEFLDSGSYEKAKGFFYRIIQDDPGNKTALICYGRAMGLSGESSEALELFKVLAQEYKGDIEVNLNLAEAYLWNKSSKSALEIYDTLLNTNPKNFTANLGRSNSLAGLGRDEEAFRSIQNTLKLDPDHPGALTSEKYIGMAFAANLIAEKQDPASALSILNNLLVSRTEDIELTFQKANILVSMDSLSEAESIYAGMDERNVEALIGISGIRRLQGIENEALIIARKAYNQALASGFASKISRSVTHYHSALLWNKQFSQAEELHKVMDTLMHSQEVFSMAKAEFEMYVARYEQGLEIYNQQLLETPGSFGANLGSAHSLHALGLDHKAYDQAYKTLGFFEGQKDTETFISNLNSIHSPYIGYGGEILNDSDNNVTKNNSLTIESSLHPQLKATVGYSHRETGDFALEEVMEANKVFAGVDYRINRVAKIKTTTGVLFVQDQNNSYSQWSGEVSTDLRLNSVHSVTLGLKREQQDFNRSLLLQDLSMNHLYLRSNMYWVRSAWGWYSEFYHTLQSDQNRRNLFFSSFYKNMGPELKSGINLQYISFQEQYPEKYYSPEDLKSVEGFVHLTKKVVQSTGVLDAEVALGYKMTSVEIQPTFRTRVSFAKTLGQRWNLKAYGMYNASAERISNGFSFFGGGVEIRYRLAMTPLFKTR